MDAESLRQIILRHEQGDRTPELISALDQAAWESFHDPWEEDDLALLEEELCRSVTSIRWDPDAPLEISATTLDLYITQHHAVRFKREERPFLLEYQDLEFTKADRKVALHVEGGASGHDVLLRAVYRLRHPKTDLPKALELIKEWNATPSSSEARAVKPTECPFTQEGKAPKAVLIALETVLSLDPSTPGLSQESFDRQFKGFLEDVGAFFEQAFDACGL